MASLKPAKGFFAPNVPNEVISRGAEISPLDPYGFEDDGMMETWMALHANEKRQKA